VVAGQNAVLVERTALDIRGLLEANIGRKLSSPNRDQSLRRPIVDLPTRQPEELAAPARPNSPDGCRKKGNLVLLKTAEGVRASGGAHSRGYFTGRTTAVSNEEFRNLLTLKLDWTKPKPSRWQKWVCSMCKRGALDPSYKLEIDGEGNAAVKLQRDPGQ